MMTLEQWIAKNHPGKRQEEIATVLGIGRSYLSLILSKSREPGRKTQMQIFKATNEQVTPNSWLERTPAPEPAKEPEEAVIEP